MASPLVTVVIPTYRRSAYLGETLASVFAQSCTDTEVIVVEDGSHDAAPALTPYATRIHYVWQTNKGVGIARNTGAAKARGEWIAFIDDDDLWEPAKLDRQLDYALRHPDVGLIHTDHLALIDGELRVPKRNPPRENVPTGWVCSKLFFGNFIITSSVMIRRSFFEQVGGFTHHRDWAEDLDLWLRLARLCTFGFVNEPLTIYRDHNQSLSSDLRSHEWRANVLENFIRTVPAIREECGQDQIRRRMRDVYWRGGYEHMLHEEYRIARRLLLKAWRWSPQDFRSLLYGLLCATGGAGVRFARAIKQGMH